MLVAPAVAAPLVADIHHAILRVISTELRLAIGLAVRRLLVAPAIPAPLAVGITWTISLCHPLAMFSTEFHFSTDLAMR